MRIYLDTNIFIAAFERRDASSDRLRDFLNAFAASATQVFCTSELTLSELLVIPLRDRNEVLSQDYQGVVSDRNVWLDVLPVTRSTLVEAARFRAGINRMKLPDAIHVAASIGSDCTHFLSEDNHLLAAGKALAEKTLFIQPDETNLSQLLESLDA